MRDEYPRANWRNPEHYLPLLDYDGSRWAGEWLRRNPAFLADLQRTSCLSGRDIIRTDNGVRTITCKETYPLAHWGLRCCLLGDDPVFFWLPQCNPLVLTVEAVYATDVEDAFDPRQCPLLKAILLGTGQEQHLLFDDGARTLQVVVQGAFVLDAPVLFRCTLLGWSEFETKPLPLRRLCCLYRRSRLFKSLYPKERRAQRWIDMLRAWDGIQAGARQREIAAVLFGERAATRDGWESGYRARVQRLVRAATQMVDGGYLSILNRAGERKDGFGTGEP